MNVPAISSPNKNKKSIIIIVSLVVLVVIVAVSYLLITRFNVKVPFIKTTVKTDEQVAEIIPLFDEKTKKPNAKFFELAMEKDYKEVQKQTDNQITSPNLYQQELREEFDKQLDRQIQNFSVTYTNNGFEPFSMTIVQGDLVTFENTSDGILKIEGEGWGSGLELDNKEINKFSQQFDLLGTYEYHSTQNPDYKGEIVVIKP